MFIRVNNMGKPMAAGNSDQIFGNDVIEIPDDQIPGDFLKYIGLGKYVIVNGIFQEIPGWVDPPEIPFVLY